MQALLDAIQAIVLASVGILIGGQVYVAVNVLDAIRKTPQSFGVRLHQELLTWRNGRINLPTAMTAALGLIAAFVVIPFTDGIKETATLILNGVALLALLTYVYQANKERPVNREINSWSPDDVPESYGELRKDWDAQQRRRLALTSITFACTMAAIMINT
jgi:hypothetical protein